MLKLITNNDRNGFTPEQREALFTLACRLGLSAQYIQDCKKLFHVKTIKGEIRAWIEIPVTIVSGTMRYRIRIDKDGNMTVRRKIK